MSSIATVGVCGCGCGSQVGTSKKTYARIGITKGSPNRFLPGHRGAYAIKTLSHGCRRCGASIVGTKSSKIFCDLCAKSRRRDADKARQLKRRQRPEFKDKYRDYSLRKNYGISRTQFEELFDSQGRTCGICKSDSSGARSRGWCVDHCHATGKVRGVLCHRCNFMIGLSLDRPESLERAAAYIRETADGRNF